MPATSEKPFTASFRFYEELNDFLPVEQRKRDLAYAFAGKPSVKDAIEAQGVPHTEVDLIVVDGASVGWDYGLEDGDRIAVYPVFESLDIGPIVQLRAQPLRQPRFILDVHLGKLARRMRLLGFDVLYRNDYLDPEIARLSVEQRRAILTRDRRLLQRRVVTHGYWLRSTQPEAQLTEVIRRFDLQGHIAPFSRCLLCNGLMEGVEKEAIADLLPHQTRQHYDAFYRCGDCGKIYWPGSHFDRLAAIVERFGGKGF